MGYALRQLPKRPRTIDRILHFIETGELEGISVEKRDALPRFVRSNVLRVGAPVRAVEVLVERVERTRNPVLPVFEEADVYCRIVPEQRVQPVSERPASRRIAGDVELTYTFTNAQSLEENLRDFARFVFGNEEDVYFSLPYDDTRQALQNLAAAHRLAITGRPVYVRRVGAPPASSPDPYDLYVSSAGLRWSVPSVPDGQLTIEYDSIADAAVIDFSGGQRSTYRLPVSRKLDLIVDINSQEAVGYSVPEALFEHLMQNQAAFSGMVRWSAWSAPSAA